MSEIQLSEIQLSEVSSGRLRIGDRPRRDRSGHRL